MNLARKKERKVNAYKLIRKVDEFGDVIRTELVNFQSLKISIINNLKYTSIKKLSYKDIIVKACRAITRFITAYNNRQKEKFLKINVK